METNNTMEKSETNLRPEYLEYWDHPLPNIGVPGIKLREELSDDKLTYLSTIRIVDLNPEDRAKYIARQLHMVSISCGAAAKYFKKFVPEVDVEGTRLVNNLVDLTSQLQKRFKLDPSTLNK